MSVFLLLSQARDRLFRQRHTSGDAAIVIAAGPIKSPDRVAHSLNRRGIDFIARRRPESGINSHSAPVSVHHAAGRAGKQLRERFYVQADRNQGCIRRRINPSSCKPFY